MRPRSQAVKKPSAEQASQSSVVRRRRNQMNIRHFWDVSPRNDTFHDGWGGFFSRKSSPIRHAAFCQYPFTTASSTLAATPPAVSAPLPPSSTSTTKA